MRRRDDQNEFGEPGEEPSRRRARRDSWFAVRLRLRGWQAPELIGLLAHLFARSPEARAAILALVLGEDRPAASLEPLRRRIRACFAVRPDGYRPPDPSRARRIVAGYARLGGDAAGTADLMLTFVESAYRFTVNYGDMDAAFYGSMHAVLARLARALRNPEARAVRDAAAQSLSRMLTDSSLGHDIDDALRAALAAAQRPD